MLKFRTKITRLRTLEMSSDEVLVGMRTNAVWRAAGRLGKVRETVY